ncbi:permease [Candidatus Uabimicrobium amorphum]|uniref:Permease n=1 Tax=Uabimicrobium amorphum TaxID=2596890 RepID=A0A5S9IJ11_UABAM|nr:permease [Candidatus Uabimicrobium amorphum]BBM82437.1 hypothetical protein UABAM_00780 [Candidatus Uabimicrobium amorphum]
MDILYGIMKETWAITVEMSPYLLFGFLCAGLLHSISSKNHILRHLSKPSFASVVKSALVGVPLPLCSCAVIPVASHLHEEGASPGATISFLTSTPNTGVDSIAVTYGMLGPVWAIVRPITAMFSGIFSGVVTNCFSQQDATSTAEDPPQQQSTKTWRNKFVSIFRYAFFDIVHSIGKWLLIGIIIGGVIAFALPQSFVDQYLHSPVVSYLAMIIIGLPMYVCSTGSIPIAVALIGKGLSPGAALIFLITGPATNSATMSYVWGKMGKKVLVAYLASIIITAISFGFMFDYFYPHINTMIHHHHHGHESSPFAVACAVFLIVLFVNAYIPRRKKTSCCSKK